MHAPRRSIPKKNRRLTPRLALTSSAKRSVRNVGATVSTHPGHVLSPQQDPSLRSPQGRLIDPHRTTYEASSFFLPERSDKNTFGTHNLRGGGTMSPAPAKTWELYRKDYIVMPAGDAQETPQLIC
ncbi:unnamed protein product [Musa acuminata subsp. malaccensis]|uniref:(wild Malaysian banana) hypothetical protein n=1 Tax=Musa acuminata subsp. malaccensis TaxID=214687 RepID=A0A804L8L3_MUSAM|nr:unnamed protein product [Musa acuminata subsp. malaccensis]